MTDCTPQAAIARLRDRLDDKTFRAFLDLLMCSDPWPIAPKGDSEDVLLAFAHAESTRRGYDGWIEAYDRFGKREKRAECGSENVQNNFYHLSVLCVPGLRTRLEARDQSAELQYAPSVPQVDAAIQDLVTALNRGGLKTVASCSGHGHRPGIVSLKDGRELFVANDYDEARQIDKAFCDIHGDQPAESSERELLRRVVKEYAVPNPATNDAVIPATLVYDIAALLGEGVERDAEK